MVDHYNYIEWAEYKKVAVLTLNRPKKINALNQAMGQEIVDALTNRLGDSRVLVISGGEQNFSAGRDLSENLPDMRLNPWRKVFDQLTNLAIPTLAAIEGYCLGGALEVVLACDLRVAAETAQLGSPEVLRGVLPGGGGVQWLNRLIGPSRTKQMLFFGTNVAGSTALDWGLVNFASKKGEALNLALSLAQQLAIGAPLALREIKYLVDKTAHLDLATAIDLERLRASQLLTTEDAQEGVLSFLEHREARFKGK